MAPLARTRPRPTPMRTTAATWVAAVLCALYSLGFVALAIWLSIALATGRGLHADTHEYLVFRGVTTTIVACAGVGIALGAGAIHALRGRRGKAAVGALSVVVVVGVIGEVIEAFTGGAASSLAIGAGIIVAAATPAVLLLLPRPAVPAAPAHESVRPSTAG